MSICPYVQYSNTRCSVHLYCCAFPFITDVSFAHASSIPTFTCDITLPLFRNLRTVTPDTAPSSSDKLPLQHAAAATSAAAVSSPSATAATTAATSSPAAAATTPGTTAAATQAPQPQRTFHKCLLALEQQVRNPGYGSISLRELKETIKISSGRYTQEVPFCLFVRLFVRLFVCCCYYYCFGGCCLRSDILGCSFVRSCSHLSPLCLTVLSLSFTGCTRTAGGLP